jgi:hypothetical protein
MENGSLNLAGALFMGISWISITGLLVFTFSKILREKEEKITGVPEIEKELDEEVE